MEQYTKENPYKLIYRFDFDKTLDSVLFINGACLSPKTGKLTINPSELNSETIENLRYQYKYLKSLPDFVKEIKREQYMPLPQYQKDDKSSYIDFIHEAWHNKDGVTYSYKEYWKTETGQITPVYECDSDPLTEQGLFAIGTAEFLPCMTREIEYSHAETYVHDYRNGD